MVSEARLRAALEGILFPGEVVLASTQGTLQNTGHFMAPSVLLAVTNDRVLLTAKRSTSSYRFDEISFITSSTSTSGTAIDGSGYLHTAGTVTFAARNERVTVLANRPIEAAAIVEATRQGINSRATKTAATDSPADAIHEALTLLREHGLLTAEEYEQKRQSLNRR